MAPPTANGRQVDTAELNRRRKLAVKLRREGRTLAETARLSGLSVPTVIAACKAHASGGMKAVAVRRMGKTARTGARLDAGRQMDIQRVLRDTLPIDHGLGGRLWDAGVVQNLILQELGVVLSPRTVARYLAQWGFAAKPQESVSKKALDSTGWTPADFRWAGNRAKQIRGLLRWVEFRELPMLSASAQGGRRGVADPDPCYLAYFATLNGSIQWQVIVSYWEPASLVRVLESAKQEIGRPLVVVATGWPFDAMADLELWNKRNEGFVEVVEGHPREFYRRSARRDR